MSTLNDIVASIRASLVATDPDLDTSVGTTTRKIIDAFAESVAASYVDQHMLTYQYDIDSKTDADLDSFTQLFGLSRLAAKRAVGTVTFTRSGDLTPIAYIPVNTQVDATTSPPVSVTTIAAATMASGVSTISVPVQAIQGGPSGNLASGTLTIIATPLSGITAVTNMQALTGGVDQETDAELRDRWKKTVFRSLAGTEQMYRGTALDDPDCTAAVVIGSSKRRREQVQIAAGAATLTVPDAAYTYPTNVYVGTNLDAGSIFLKDYDYTWNYASNPPTITVLVSANIPNGTLVEVDYEYQPTSSRNDPANGILNRVDVWTSGTRPVAAQQSIVFNQSRRFTNVLITDQFDYRKFRRDDGANPTANDVFVPLVFGPILQIPDIISTGGNTYSRDGSGIVGGVTFLNAYRVVHDDTAFGYGPYSMFGIQWYAAHLPANNSVFTIGSSNDYVYNQIPASVQQGINRWRLAGVDALAHAAKAVPLRFSLNIMYDRKYSQGTVNTAIDVALSTLCGNVGMAGTLQVSDVLQAVHNVPGVDAVRFVIGTDITGYTHASDNTYNIAIQKVVLGAVTATYDNTLGHPTDIYFSDNTYPTLESCVKVVKAQNSFGIG